MLRKDQKFLEAYRQKKLVLMDDALKSDEGKPRKWNHKCWGSYSEKKTKPFFFPFRFWLAGSRLGLDNSKLWVRGSNQGPDNDTKTNKELEEQLIHLKSLKQGVILLSLGLIGISPYYWGTSPHIKQIGCNTFLQIYSSDKDPINILTGGYKGYIRKLL